MMHADLPGLLARLDAAGVGISIRLDVEGPDDALTDDLLGEIKAARPALLARLAREELWRELAPLRWGPAVSDPEGGIDVRGPAESRDLARRLAAVGADRDTYALDERVAIQDATPD